MPSQYHFGYNHNKEPFPQLLDLLGLPAASTVSKGIKETLRELTRRHLDEKFSPFSQPQALKNVEKELLQRHPDLFAKEDQENKLYFALRVVSRFHNSRRYAISERQKRVKQAESVAEKHNKENIVINISDSVTTSKRVRGKNYPPFLKEEDVCNESISLAKRRIPRSSSRAMRAYSQNGSPCGVMPQRPSLSTHLKAEPVIANEGIQLRKGAIKKTSASDCMEEYITVRQFLETCVPAMDHLLMSFIQFGCTTEEYLRSFAAFGLKKRRQVLESIFAGYLAADGNENNRGATEMDLAVLEDHLDRYFL